MITAYTVTATPGGQSVTVGGPLPVTSAAIVGLTPGTSNTFTVAATNSSGTGVPSAASNPITPNASLATIPSPTAGGWQGNGTAILANGGLQLTDAVTKFSAGSAFYPTAVTAASSFAASFDAVSDQGTGADGLVLAFGDVKAGVKATSKGQSGRRPGLVRHPGIRRHP